MKEPAASVFSHIPQKKHISDDLLNKTREKDPIIEEEEEEDDDILDSLLGEDAQRNEGEGIVNIKNRTQTKPQANTNTIDDGDSEICFKIPKVFIPTIT